MSPTYLEHHGILGQKWGIRRYQNPDGSLTSAGKERYGAGNTAKDRGSKVPADMKADIEAINGGKNGIYRSYLRHNNCAFCSVAYEMRRRGENVRAQESLDGVNPEAYRSAVKNLSNKDIKDYGVRKSAQAMEMGMTKDEFNGMTSDILKDGPNSRGQVSVRWKARGESGVDSGGHALNYEVKDGTFYLVDPQVGKAFSGKDAYNYLSNAINIKTYRTDNKTFDKKITEKYFTEQDTGRIKNRAKAQTVSEISAVSAFALANSGIGLPLAIPALIVSAAAGKKAERQKQEDTLALENKWQQEKRHSFYDNTQKKGKKK